VAFRKAGLKLLFWFNKHSYELVELFLFSSENVDALNYQLPHQIISYCFWWCKPSHYHFSAGSTNRLWIFFVARGQQSRSSG